MSERADEGAAPEGVEPALPMAARVRALLAGPPWLDRPYALTLLAVDPPEGVPAIPQRLWLILDAADARDFDDEWREPLLRHRLRRIREQEIETTVATTDGVETLLEGVSRRALEVRWEFRHATALHDPSGRGERLTAIARRFPEDALERLTRPLYLQAGRALEALHGAHAASADAPGGATVAIAAGEAASALTRLACILEEGAHPTADWLDAAARQTALGRRIGPWLDSRSPAVADSVLGEAARALHAYFADREWLREPEIYALRPPPRR